MTYGLVLKFCYASRRLYQNLMGKKAKKMHARSLVRNRIAALTLVPTFLIPLATAVAAPAENGAAGRLGSGALGGIRINEIFQRTMPQNSADVVLRVVAPPPYHNYYSISLLNAFGTRQTVLKEGSYNGQSILSFSLPPQANFSQVRVSFYNSSMVEGFRWDSPLFNVGEVFLVAGQSNAANHGEVGATPWFADAKHRAIDPDNAGTWTQLQARMPYATPKEMSTTGSPWVSFANELSSRLGGVPVALLNVAFGGSALEFWEQGHSENLFSRLVVARQTLSRLNTNGSNTCSFRAVLWHQGESNAERDFGVGTNGQYGPPDRKWYAQALTKVAKDFGQTGCTQPWMVASASWLDLGNRINDKKDPTTKFRAETEVRKGQRYLWSRSPLNAQEPVFKAGPDTDLMNGETPAHGAPGYRFDGIHMSRAGLELHGKLWAARVANLINPALPLSTEKDLIPEVTTVWNAFINTMGRTAAEIELDNEGLRWWAQSKIVNPGIDVASSMATSDEKFVRDTFQNVLSRRPTWWEANYWVTQLATGATTRGSLIGPSKVGYEFTLSPNARKIFRLFVNTMGRTLPEIQQDAAGLAYWTSVLDSNAASEASIDSSFRTSAEYRVRSAFVKSFGRQPNAAELNKYISSTSLSDAALAQAVWTNEAP